jgi:two-component system nitrate/nitrite response regulator NarL
VNVQVREGASSGLTRREEQIVKLIDEGLTNKEIAVHLHIEVSTVKNHIHNVLDKLQLQDRYSAAKYFKGLGPIKSGR